jgi:dienelactone hydrolase
MGSERQAEAYRVANDSQRHVLHSLARLRPDDPRAVRVALTEELRTKGRVLDATAGGMGALRRAVGLEDRALFDALLSRRTQLAQLELRGPGEMLRDPAARAPLLLGELHPDRRLGTSRAPGEGVAAGYDPAVIASAPGLAAWACAFARRAAGCAARRLLLAALLAGASACATAPLRPVAPGAPVELAADEGLLVVHIDTAVPLERVSLDRAVASGALPSGRHVWLVRLPVGRYRWAQISFGSQAGSAQVYRFEPGDEDVRFDVEAGKINYPGELVIRAHPMARSVRGAIQVRNRNHSARAVRELGKVAREILSAFPLRHAGPSRDGFLEHYSRERDRARGASQNGGGPVALPSPTRDGRGGVASAPRGAGSARAGHSAALLFSEDGIQDVIVSPRGEWVLAHAVHGRAHGLLLQGQGFDSVRTAFAALQPIVEMAWAGRDAYLAVFATGDGHFRTLLGRVVAGEGEAELEHEWIDAPGGLVDPLPLVDDAVLWEFDHRGRNSVHRVGLEDLVHFHDENRLGGRSIEIGETVASIRGSARRWITDRRGQPRAALLWEEGVWSIRVRPEGEDEFREVYRFDETDDAAARYPVALTPDGTKLVVAAYHGRDTLGLFEADMQGEIQGVLFVQDDVDVADVVIDRIDGGLIAAVTFEGGESRFHYFDSYAGQQLEPLREAFPKEEVHVVSADADRSVLVFRVSGPNDPGTYYLRNGSKGETIRIAEAASGVRGRELVDVEAIAVLSKDGTRVEAFLAVPSVLGPSGAPLVVRPHGGPIGVRDTRHYDALVQYLASWGFATLQVNYRGSSGYGRAFEEGGKREWARGIEDDVDAAVEHVLRRPEIDPSRVCIIGGSYGGFSAVASVVRHRHRYRCAATLNGASDIPLLFEESDCAESERCVESLKQVVGDPETERDRLVDASPVYHVREIETPVFVSYGTNDTRVDPDHSHRLVLMLETLGLPHEALEIQGAAHAPTRREWVIYARALRRFLTKHLLPEQGFVGDPEPSGEGAFPASAPGP